LQFAIEDQAAGVVDGRDHSTIANCILQIGDESGVIASQHADDDALYFEPICINDSRLHRLIRWL
jgi:hypothetical protein